MTAGTLTSAALGGPVMPTPSADLVLAPLTHDAVILQRSGWLGAWQVRTLTEGLTQALRQVEEGARGNLMRLLDPQARPHRDLLATDCDVHQMLEAFAWAAGSLDADDPRLARAGRLVTLLEQVQEADGYLNSWVQVQRLPHWSEPQRGQEMRAAGHLLQAAVAASRTGTLPGLMGVADRLSDLLVTTFADAPPRHLEETAGVVGALAELFRSTGRGAYLELARTLLRPRGHATPAEGGFGKVNNANVNPVPVWGPADLGSGVVQRLQLLAGAADVAAETRDRALLDAVVRAWADPVMSITGSRELPTVASRTETSAAIAAFHLNWRLLLATGESRYADAMELLLHNGIALGALGTCPPDLACLLAGVHDYLLTRDGDGIQLHHPTSANTALTVAGALVRLNVWTGYPYDGRIGIEVETASQHTWQLSVRIPAWCNDFRLEVDGVPVVADSSDGYVRLRRGWEGRHYVVLTLDLAVRLLHRHHEVSGLPCCVAVARGPVAYAMAEADLPPSVEPADVRFVAVTGVRSARVAGPAPVVDVRLASPAVDGSAVRGRERGSASQGLFDVGLVPRHLPANRLPGARRVWIPMSTGGDVPL